MMIPTKKLPNIVTILPNTDQNRLFMILSLVSESPSLLDINRMIIISQIALYQNPSEICPLQIKKAVKTNVRKTHVITKIIRLGPVGITGTYACCNIVNAGVVS